MQAVKSWNVRQNVCKAFILFQLVKFMFKPLELVSWITSILVGKQPPVGIVTSLHVQCDQLTFLLERERLRIVPVLSKNFDFFFTQPIGVVPRILEVVDGVVLARLREILHIDRPCVMVTDNWEHLDLLIADSIFESLSDGFGVHCDLFVGVTPDVVT